MPAYYFDRASRTCRLFFYGGCGGNENRFETLADCAAACEVDGAAMRAVRDVCQGCNSTDILNFGRKTEPSSGTLGQLQF